MTGEGVSINIERIVKEMQARIDDGFNRFEFKKQYLEHSIIITITGWKGKIWTGIALEVEN